MSFPGGQNFTPKPREILTGQHELRAVAEAVFVNKQMLSQYAQHGDQLPQGMFQAGANQVPVPYACAVICLQFGIPHDHPQCPEIAMFNTRHKANDAYIKWKAGEVISWETDDTFHYIPGYTRYVVNQAGTIKNAANGETVTENFVGDWIKLVKDGRAPRVSGIDKAMLTMLAWAKLPEDFIDYGFGVFSYELAMNEERTGLVFKKLPAVSARSNIDGTISKARNVHEFIRNSMTMKNFNALKEAQEAARKMKPGDMIVAGEFTVTTGDVSDPIAFGPAPGAQPAMNNMEAANNNNGYQPPVAPAASPFNQDVPF